MVLINPEVTDEALSTEVDLIGGFLTSNGGEITYLKRDTPWGRRRLAYPIERFRDATYVLYQFMGSPSSLTEIERELKLDDRIIRYLLVRQEKLRVPEDEIESPEEIAAAAEDAEEEPETAQDQADEIDFEGDEEESDETEE